MQPASDVLRGTLDLLILETLTLRPERSSCCSAARRADLANSLLGDRIHVGIGLVDEYRVDVGNVGVDGNMS